MVAKVNLKDFSWLLSISLLLVSLLFSVSAQADDFTLDQLMPLLASQKTLQAEFTEEKFDSYLELPLLLKGQVSFKAPHYLEKIIHTPVPQSFILDGDLITIKDKHNKAKQYALDRHPEIRAFAESFRSTLAGDLESLGLYYNVRLSGQLEEWVMQLIPANRKISRAIKEIIINGTQHQLSSVITRQHNGDYSVMTFIQLGPVSTANE